MSFQSGTYQRLQVLREVPPNGFFLDAGDREVLLHYSEIVGERPQIGDEVEVFLYFDTEDRPAATQNRPLLTYGQMQRLQVADVHPRLGCFLEMGLGRHLLLPLSELPERREYRPQVKDEVFVRMERDKAGRLLAKLAREDDLARHVFDVPAAWHNTQVEGWVTKTLQIGSFVLIDGGVTGFGAFGFIPADARVKPLRLGERIAARVTFIREDGRANLSTAPRKEIGRVEDAERILQFLQARPNGAMPYSDETPPDLIKQKFEISKAAFKRALGKLMREGKVTQKGSWTYLVQADNNTEHD